MLIFSIFNYVVVSDHSLCFIEVDIIFHYYSCSPLHILVEGTIPFGAKLCLSRSYMTDFCSCAKYLNRLTHDYLHCEE